MEMGRSKASSLVLLLIYLLQISADQQIRPSRVVLLQDCTNNVDGGLDTQMRASIEKMLAQEPVSHVFSGCIGEKLGNTINSASIGTMLIQEFKYSRFNRSSEIMILLINSKTKLTGTVPDIVSLKKTIVIQFGQKEQVWTNMASKSDLAFQVQVPEDIAKVEKQLAEELAIMSELVCDTIEYCMDREHRSSLYTRCQCQSCSNLCNFKSANESDSCMDYCRYDPHFKDPQKSDKPVTTLGTGNDAWEKTLIIVIPVIFAFVVAAVKIYRIKKRKKMKQPINDVEAHQEQNDYVAEHNGEASGVSETTRMINEQELSMNDGNDENVSDISGNEDSADSTSDGNGNGETTGGTDKSGVNESGVIIKSMKELGLNLNAYECQPVHQKNQLG